MLFAIIFWSCANCYYCECRTCFISEIRHQTSNRTELFVAQLKWCYCLQILGNVILNPMLFYRKWDPWGAQKTMEISKRTLSWLAEIIYKNVPFNFALGLRVGSNLFRKENHANYVGSIWSKKSKYYTTFCQGYTSHNYVAPVCRANRCRK